MTSSFLLKSVVSVTPCTMTRRLLKRPVSAASWSRAVSPAQILNAVAAEDLPGPGTVFLQVNWSFKAPVRPGDTITGEVEVRKARPDKPITESTVKKPF